MQFVVDRKGTSRKLYPKLTFFFLDKLSLSMQLQEDFEENQKGVTIGS